jgi:YfiH family protein
MPEPELLHAEVLALPGCHHGFTTRLGGVSTGPFAELNLSPKWYEQQEAVEQNYDLLARAAGFDRARLYRVRQVHGARGVRVEGQPVAEVQRTEADFLLTDRPGVTVGVITADCVPVLLADRARPAVAAAHAGWRGLVAGVIEAAVEALQRQLGSRPRNLVAAHGPCIGRCCFEVGPEVAEQFDRALPSTPGIVVPPGELDNPKPHVDLWRAARAVLERAGLPLASIADPPACTMCDEARFFSFRRQGSQVGQHLSFIGLKE